MATWRPYNWVKFTLKTRVNSNVTQKLDFSDGLSNVFSDLESDDYWSIGAYDVRCKVYATKRLRLTGRMFITGVQAQNYAYYGGIIIKI